MSRSLRFLGIATAVAFLFSAYTPLWNDLGARLAVEPNIRKADAIVVLGAGILPDHSMSDESLRRAFHGMQLFKQGFGDVLVLSGPENRLVPGKSEAEVRRDIAVQFGIDADRVRMVDRVNTTRDEAHLVATLLGGRRSTTILLVTEAAHMRRAMGVFERAGLTVLPAPSDNSPGSSISPGGRLSLIPSVLGQSAALLYYKLAGYI